jgi:hypothetical protein
MKPLSGHAICARFASVPLAHTLATTRCHGVLSSVGMLTGLPSPLRRQGTSVHVGPERVNRGAPHPCERESDKTWQT